MRFVSILALMAVLFSGAASCSLAAKQPVATITYEIAPDSGSGLPQHLILETTVDVLRSRLDAAGYGETVVKAVEPDRILIGVVKDSQRGSIERLTGMTGRLEFVLLPAETYGTSRAPGETPVPAVGTAIDPGLTAEFNGDQMDPKWCEARFDSDTQEWVVDFAFRSGPASAFENWTGHYVNRFFAIVLDGKVLSVPSIRGPVPNGEGTIRGAGFTQESASQLASILKSGSLPRPLTEVSVETGWKG